MSRRGIRQSLSCSLQAQATQQGCNRGGAREGVQERGPYLSAFLLHVLHDVIVLFIIGQFFHGDSFLEPHNVGGPWQDGWGYGRGVHVGHVHLFCPHPPPNHPPSLFLPVFRVLIKLKTTIRRFHVYSRARGDEGAWTPVLKGGNDKGGWYTPLFLVVTCRVGQCAPGPAVVPPTAARALLKKVAMFCSLAVGGSPPT
ncbi:MAG: hypothetical protein FRX49_11901 [Trebouxia sp. A1-2]|nr:MAG: hypothetical protein FRX49_11901 [Trebouxia sp. A1-2]